MYTIHFHFNRDKTLIPSKGGLKIPSIKPNFSRSPGLILNAKDENEGGCVPPKGLCCNTFDVWANCMMTFLCDHCFINETKMLMCIHEPDKTAQFSYKVTINVWTHENKEYKNAMNLFCTFRWQVPMGQYFFKLYRTKFLYCREIKAYYNVYNPF